MEESSVAVRMNSWDRDIRVLLDMPYENPH